MIVFLPFIFFYRVIYKANSYFARSVAWLLKVAVGINYKIEGLDNLPIRKLETGNWKLEAGNITSKQVRVNTEGEANSKNFQPKTNNQQPTKGFVIASKHQSAWETFIAFAFLPKVSFVYKKELGYIPIYGWYNKAYKNICADRKGGAKALKSIIEQTKDRVEKGHQVIIFPQGTRTAFGQVTPYKSSVYAMYKAGIDIYPAALNSGNCWPKKGIKKSGTIVWKFLPKIEQGLDKKEFMQRLEEVIESESNKLNF
jgi:1-acyl-sn-glycerol-3-phosphate acyltransferase